VSSRVPSPAGRGCPEGAGEGYRLLFPFGNRHLAFGRPLPLGEGPRDQTAPTVARQTLRTVFGSMLESGRWKLKRGLGIGICRLKEFICGCGRNRTAMDLSPDAQSTLKVIVASFDE
jgi:hypothetical protein